MTVVTDQLKDLDAVFEERSKNASIENRLKALKREAWERFKALPMPSCVNEKWRFSNLEFLSVNPYDFSMNVEEKNGLEDRLTEHSQWLNESTGRNVFVDGKLVNRIILNKKGAVLQTFDEAWDNYGELIESYFFKGITQLGGEKFHYMNLALSGDALFIYVPRGIVLEKPILNYHWLDRKGGIIFPATYLLVEEGAYVKVIDIFLSTEGNECGFCCGTNLTHVKTGGNVERIAIQLFNNKTVSMQMESAFVEEKAKLQSVWINLGSQYARLENQVYLNGNQANAQLYSLGIARGNQEFDQRTYQVHAEGEATSDLLYKNAILDEARTVFSGLIRVHKDAQKTDAYQKNRNLLLSEEAEAVALPGLEIEANDVKCSHGATSGKIDEAELFYMLSRGIHKEKAQELLVLGFLEEIVEKISDQVLKQFIHREIEKKFSLK